MSGKYTYNTIWKNKFLTSDREKLLQTSEASEDFINRKTFNTSPRKLQKIPLYSGNDCFKSWYNLLDTGSLIATGN